MFSKEYLLGIVFIVLVALIWAASSVVAQFVYSTDSFDSPFLLTYIGTSLFTLWLPIRYSSKLIASSSNPSNSENDVLLTEPSYQNVEQAEEAIHHHPDATVETAAASTTVTIITTHEASPGTTDLISARWTNDDHLRVALRIAPVWFIANWTYNASLLYTSITSSTVLASTSSLFTFLFAVLVKDERFSWIRLAGVCLGVTGGVFTALHDASERRRRLASAAPGDDDSTDAIALLGDFLGLVSAVGYGAYAVQTRVYCPKDESLYSMQLLLGYIGLLNMTVLSPIAIYVMASTGDLQWLVVGCIFLKGLFDNFLSDYLWLRAVLLTNATVATVGLGLTIPLAFGSDVLLGKPDVLTVSSIFGALAVLVGFVLVNIGNDDVDEARTLSEDDSPMEMRTRVSSANVDGGIQEHLANHTID